MEEKSKNRRKFLRQLALIFTSIAGFLALVSLFRQGIPRKALTNKRIKIGNPNSFPLNMFTYIPEANIFVNRDHSGIKAVSAICTHLGCVIEKSEDGFQCPCHGSCYDEDGDVVSGAATKALDWYHLYRDPDGQIVVDLRRTEDAKYRLRT